MNAAIKTILTTVIAAAIVGLAANLFQVNTRLARMEAKIELLTPHLENHKLTLK